MPTYEFHCAKCGKKKDEFHTMQKVPRSIKCECGDKMERQFGSGTGFMFTDWFVNGKIKKNND